MDTQPHETSAPIDNEASGQICHEHFPLRRVLLGKPDKLGNIILEILWCGSDYAVYRTNQGVFVNFADCPIREREQRAAFTEICPELCELRYLTSQMHHTWLRRIGILRRRNEAAHAQRGDGSLYDHNMAQAVMLLMEGKTDDARKIAKAALSMAVMQSTSDNTIRYVSACVGAALFACAVISALGYYLKIPGHSLVNYCIAANFGTIGAAFSIITRVQAFRLKPCQQSNMNYLMGGIRVCIGLVGGLMLFLLAGSSQGKMLVNQQPLSSWHGAAIIGFLGGFA